MCTEIIILQTNKPYPSSCSWFVLVVFFFFFFFYHLLPSYSSSSSSLFFSFSPQFISCPISLSILLPLHCSSPSCMKMCDNAVDWSWIPFPAPLFHSLCCLPRSSGTCLMVGSRSKGKYHTVSWMPPWPFLFQYILNCQLLDKCLKARNDCPTS